MSKVAISIVNYGEPSVIKSCLLSLGSLDTTADVTVAVVDNFSNSSNRMLIASICSAFDNLHLILLDSNQGFSAGHNAAINFLLERKDFDYMWLLNSDCQVSSTALSEHIKEANLRPEILLWGSTLLEASGEIVQVAGGCAYFPWLSMFKECAKGKSVEDLMVLQEPSFDYIAGASLFFTRKGLEHALILQSENSYEKKYLNEEFFLYFEELDLAERIGRQSLGWCKAAMVKHIGGATSNANGRRSSKIAEYHSNLSALKYTKIYHPEKFWSVYVFRILAKFVQLAWRRQFGLMSSVINAYYAYHGWSKNNKN